MKMGNATINLILIGFFIVAVSSLGILKSQKIISDKFDVNSDSSGQVNILLKDEFNSKYDDFAGSIWVDGELLCCDTFKSGSMSCSSSQYTPGSRAVDVYVVGFKTGILEDDICSYGPIGVSNLVSSSGINRLTYYSGPDYSLHKRTVNMYTSGTKNYSVLELLGLDFIYDIFDFITNIVRSLLGWMV